MSHRHRRFFGVILLLIGLFNLNSAFARIEAYTFETEQQEATYKKLIHELRCLVCQNQNLADSNAELALDMRHKTYEMVKDGHSEQEIVDFMVARYGDFVMYRPPVKSTTLFLWYGPAILLLLAVVVVTVFIRKQKAAVKPTEDVSSAQKQRAHTLLDDE
mgnify:CR=1 FL=1